MSNFYHNYSDQQLADHMGTLDLDLKARKKQLDAMKAEFKRRGLTDVEGERYTVTASTTERWSLDTARVKQAMGEAWYNLHSRISPVTTIRIAETIRLSDVA